MIAVYKCELPEGVCIPSRRHPQDCDFCIFNKNHCFTRPFSSQSLLAPAGAKTARATVPFWVTSKTYWSLQFPAALTCDRGALIYGIKSSQTVSSSQKDCPTIYSPMFSLAACYFFLQPISDYSVKVLRFHTCEEKKNQNSKYCCISWQLG